MSHQDYSPEVVEGYWKWLPKTLQGSVLDPDRCLCFHFFRNLIEDNLEFEAAHTLVAKLVMDLYKAGYSRNRNSVLKWSEYIA